MTMKPLPVLYLTYDGLTDPLGSSQILPYLLKLQSDERLITIISAEKPHRFETGKKIIKDQINQSNISWQPLKYHATPPVISTLYDIWNMWRAAKKLVKKEMCVVHCRSYVTALIGLSLKKKYGCPFVFDMRGFWADERIDGGIWSLSNPIHKVIYRYFKRKEKDFFKEADAVISLTEEGKSEIVRIFNIPSEKISVIPCCVDRQHFNPQNQNPEVKQRVRRELGIEENQIVITYLGSIGTWYLLDEMLAFFKVFREEYNNAVFLFLTKDAESEILTKTVKNGLDMESIRVQGVDRSLVPDFLSISDFTIFFIKPCFSKKASSPTKMGESLSMGIPVIGNSNVGDVEWIIDQFNCGLYLGDFKDQNFKELMESLNKKDLAKLKIASEQAAKEFFDIDTGVATYEAIYQALS